ncbi:MAG: Rpn family recombination-promoting nuclease/putative transposase, partial [Clostridiales bacterium]|nr:Rpn family recombination-promoting nuclease/putative transposase [Clostridiales bacterium]
MRNFLAENITCISAGIVRFPVFIYEYKSQYKADDGRIHEEERDVSKIVKNKNIRISLVGLEHQTDIDPDEPLRVIGYDGAAYRSQMLHGQKERYPVVTMVLYFGTKRWNS